MKKIKWVLTNQFVVFHTEGENPISFRTNEPKCEKILNLLGEGKEDEVYKILFEPQHSVIKYTNNTIRIDGSNVYIGSDTVPLHPAITKKLLAFYNNNLPYEPFLKFWNNVKWNPSIDSIDQLMIFLEYNNLPITDDGCFIGYKYVSYNGKDYLDSYTKTIKNNPGDRPKMDRQQVNSDRNTACSTGLHVAAYKYVEGNPYIMEVKVNPKDVVSVPYDYNNQKMRVCEYEVIGLSHGERKEEYIFLGNDTDTTNTTTDTFNEQSADDFVTGNSSFDFYDNSDDDVYNDEEKVINFFNLTAREIIDKVHSLTGLRVTCSPKSKKTVIQHATKILEENGYTVEWSFT